MYSLTFTGNPGYLKPLEIDTYLDGTRETASCAMVTDPSTVRTSCSVDQSVLRSSESCSRDWKFENERRSSMNAPIRCFHWSEKGCDPTSFPKSSASWFRASSEVSLPSFKKREAPFTCGASHVQTNNQRQTHTHAAHVMNALHRSRALL